MIMTYFFSIFFGTFILEDVALVSSLAMVSNQKLNIYQAFLACFLGITIGDLLLYLLGAIAARFKLENRFSLIKKIVNQSDSLRKSNTLTYSIIVSRFIPGTRLPTYILSGFLKYSFIRFTILTFISVFAWVLIAFTGGLTLISIFKKHWAITIMILWISLIFLKFIMPQVVSMITNPWLRKAFWPSLKKWKPFEFWPGPLFYIPLVPYYIYLSLKHHSFLNPLYANPQVKHGGLIGESKWDFLQYLNKQDSSTLKSIKLNPHVELAEAQQIIKNENFMYPFILKPDIGQRGFGVRIIKNENDLKNYLSNSPFERILQAFSQYKKEAGIFYIRKPSEKRGQIFSITDKDFPFVTGDGLTRLGDLILKDSRAQIIANIYFERLKDQLDYIPEKNKIIYLSECGNHCQGAIFFNGAHLKTEALLNEFERLSLQIPDFYFGRFDIRYQNKESLIEGKNFEIVEINGAGAEGTHIWDASTTLLEAYKSLFLQWSLLFQVGAEVKKLYPEKNNIKLYPFLKECLRVFNRKENLSVSS